MEGGQILWAPDSASSNSRETQPDQEGGEIDPMEQLLSLKEMAELTGYSVKGLNKAIHSGSLWGIKEEKKGRATGRPGRPGWQTTLAAVEEYVTGQPEFRRMKKLVQLFGDLKDRPT